MMMRKIRIIKTPQTTPTKMRLVEADMILHADLPTKHSDQYILYGRIGR
jgi:hypothetical protein